ncbi:hypothetical protein GGP77_000461 [Salinibacter ruber]|uniref:DUF4097 family beta strand repeat-containing protein n=2 Tax=Salinibacter ruber TaxID=146919 RepID=UPI0021670ED8|nr:DUF4097 family beta strand repeat-containing protein [Salinibacter ruber]MCS3636636.1 hypothetical protein [Salinibacter ruber]MCS3666260.1 hypothetical protein [Salinibacter ruber]MCS4049991.1 hypothetical protein [Salinibacter ruber]MCS4146525.1 hypothetical protein [Salinibacter ruber]
MRWSSTALAIFGMLGLAVLGGGCQRGQESEVARSEDGVLRLGPVEVVDTVARAVAPSDRPLVVEGLRGSVRLTGAEQTTADLSFVRRGRGDTREAGQSVVEGISITESGTDAEYAYTLAADQEDYAAVDVRGRVPRRTALRVDRLSGPVHVAGVEGALTVSHAHGDVTVQGAAGAAEVRIKNGDVAVGFQSLPPGGTHRIETANGDLRLRLPPDETVQIDAQTDAGTIRTRGLSFTNEQFAPINAGARYDAQTGDGGPTVELRTQNGSIVIEAADTSATDTTSAPATVPSSDTTVTPPPSADTAETTAPDTIQADTTAADTTRR